MSYHLGHFIFIGPKEKLSILAWSCSLLQLGNFTCVPKRPLSFPVFKFGFLCKNANKATCLQKL